MLGKEWLEARGVRIFALVENPTRLRLSVFEEPGKNAGDSDVLAAFSEELRSVDFRREEVEGGLGGSVSKIDMVIVRS